MPTAAPTRTCTCSSARRLGRDLSGFVPSWSADDPSVRTDRGSRIEGIGRPRVEPSFVPTVVDRMVSVPDAASIAATRWVSAVTGRMVGGSTGTNMWGAFRLVAEMRAAGREGSVVTLLCDGGERYGHTYDDDSWLDQSGLDITPYTKTLDHFGATGDWHEPS
jgi:cysteine synthase